MKTGRSAVLAVLSLGIVVTAGPLMRAQPASEESDPVVDAIGGMLPVDEEPADDEGGLYVNPEWFEPQEETEKPADSSLDGGAYAPGEGDSMADGYTPDRVPEDVVELVWPLIDTNRDGRGTDREIYRAIRTSRVLLNAKDEETEAEDAQEAEANERAAAVRQRAMAMFDENANGLLDRPEAILMLSLVRGARCPTAQRAIAYWEGLDADDDSAVVAAEVVARLEPLGPVGIALARPLSRTLERIDMNRDDQISRAEAYYSANAMLRVQLATEGSNLAGRSPATWLQFVAIVSALDVDADNRVSTAEAAAEGMQEAIFRQIDSNGDQYLTPSEMCDLQERLEAQMQAALAAAAARNSGGIAGG